MTTTASRSKKAAKEKKQRSEAPSPETDPALVAAIARVDESPSDDDAWDELEELADKLQAPDDVAAAYRRALDRGLGKADAPRIADRAVKFCQAWFIDTPEAMPELLTAIVERYPELEWAFERLVVLLTSSAEWDPLLALYDRMLGVTRDEKKRRHLLDDAARLAKDFADQPDRAADYLQQLLALDPANDKLVTSLERLLERRERHDDLLALWRERIPSLPTEEARATRVRIAEISLSKLGSAEQALAELRQLVEESPGHAEACALLERILAEEGAAATARRESLDLLRTTYEVVARPDDVVRVLTAALAFVSGEDGRAIRRELGNRLAILGRDEQAMEHYAALLRDAPGDSDARRQLRQLARRSGRHEVLVEALTAAAEAAEDDAEKVALWLAAADVRRRALEDVKGAVELYQRVIDAPGADEADARQAAHQLNELLALEARGNERLKVLERLASLERSPSLRRQILGEAARLAEELGDDERAIASWEQVTALEAHDLEALAALAVLYERHERWTDLVAVLSKRGDAAVSDEQRKADLMRVARLEHEKLGDRDGAIARWSQIRDRFGESREVLNALDALLAEAERHEELAALLDGAVTRERGDVSHHLVRLGDLYRESLGRTADAARLYRQALELDPHDADARAGAHALLDDAEAAKEAGEALWRAYERSEEVAPRLSLVEPRLRHLDDPAQKAALLAEAATLHEQAGDRAAALAALRQAVPLDPTQRSWHERLERLGAAEQSWGEVANAFLEAADASDAPSFAAELRRREARIHAEERGKHALAFKAYEAAAQLVPDDAGSRIAAARSAARAGLWQEAAGAAVASFATLGRVDEQLWNDLAEAARESASPEDLARCLADAVSAREGSIDPRLASDLYGRIAGLHPDDGDLEAAMKAAQRAVALAPGDREAQERLVALQRRLPGRPGLVESLLALDAQGDERQLDALREAAEVALADGVDATQARRAHERLFAKASRLWRTKLDATGNHRAEDCARWALEKLEERLVGTGSLDAAAELLLRGGELPLPPAERGALHRRAAEHLVAAGSPLRAIDAYRRALADTPDDLALIRALAQLCEREEAQTGAAALRARELELTDDLDTRLELRLREINRTGSLEESRRRVELLLENLEDSPGHPASVDALVAILRDRGEHAELATVLEKQAVALEDSAAERAAHLWSRVADVAEEQLDDPARAIAAHSRVVALVESPRSLDALARLHLARGEAAEAAKWLRQRLESAAPKQKVAVRLKLAKAQLAAGFEGDAVTTLSSAFDEAPQSAEVRKQLIPLLRQREDWRALASVLTRSIEHTGDDAAVLAYAREAADVLHRRLGQPEDAIDALRRAVTLAPDDRKLRAMLAESLRTGGELDEARTLLEALITSFGRRGSEERAQAHMQLARVLHAQGEHEAALAQLDIASKMDADNVEIIRTLSELAREAGQLERAEAALRTLLLTARRLQASDSEATPIGTSEVLFELSSIARARGQADQAEELAESAIESLAEGDAHAPRLQAKLREQGEHGLLVRLLDARLGYVRSPYRRGQILAEKAEAHRAQGDPKAAFEARLEAIEADPGSPLLHLDMRELAEDLGRVDDYRKHLEAILERSRRDTDAMTRCEVLLRLGEIEEKAERFEAAAAFYDQAEATGVREVDVLRARARVAGARGDEGEQMRILEQLASLGEDQVETRADALYRIAEVQLAAADSLDNGLDALRKALTDNPRSERACTILRRACDQHADHGGLLDLYEQVARNSGDDAALLDYLERRARHESATPDQVREAVQKAEAIGETGRAEALMQRAVDLAREEGAGLYAVDWALLGLARLALDRGEVREAVSWLEEAGEVAEPEPLFALSQRVADAAAAGGEPALAAKLYEKLRERDSMARDAWEPLVRIYTELGDIEGLERVVRETLDGLQETDDRNALRLGLARALLRDPERLDDAIGVLREALFEAPGQGDALELLADSLERGGRDEELVELLRDQLYGAKDRGDAATIKRAALRLAARASEDEAVDVLRDALEATADAEIIDALLARLGEDEKGERAQLLERQLETAEGARAAALAKQAAALYEELGETGSVLGALEAGLARCPEDDEIRSRLETHYREQGDADGLARILESTAAACEGPQKAVLLAEAAVVRRDQLGDPGAAVSLLAQARAIDPTSAKLTVEHARTIEATGDRDAALAVLGEGLEHSDGESDRLALLEVRAEIRSAAGDYGGAQGDLEAAYAIDPDAVRERLAEALDLRRSRAAAEGDQETERVTTLRVVDLMLEQGRRDEVRMLLTEYSDRHPTDAEVLRQLVGLAREDGQWEEVERTCRLLADIEVGDAQIEAAAGLLEACERLDNPELARETLERVWASQPSNATIRGHVRHLYELIGAHGELARLLIDESRDIADVDEKIAHLRWAGEALLATGDLATARVALEEVLALRPDDPEALCLVVDAHIMQAEFDRAHQLLDEAISSTKRTDPAFFMLYQRKSYVHQAEGDPYSQLDALKRAYQAARKNPQVAAELADLAEALEEWDLAVATLRSITTMEEVGPIAPASALVRQGRIAVRLGDDKRARLCARRAAMTDAEADDVKAFLAELGEG